MDHGLLLTEGLAEPRSENRAGSPKIRATHADRWSILWNVYTVRPALEPRTDSAGQAPTSLSQSYL